MMKRICAQFWNPLVIPVMWVCLDSATTQNSWRTSAQRTNRVFTFGRGLNFDLALYAGRMSICALRTSLCGVSHAALRASRMLRGGADNAERGQRGIRARIGAESADKADPRLPF